MKSTFEDPNSKDPVNARIEEILIGQYQTLRTFCLLLITWRLKQKFAEDNLDATYNSFYSKMDLKWAFNDINHIKRHLNVFESSFSLTLLCKLFNDSFYFLYKELNTWRKCTELLTFKRVVTLSNQKNKFNL